MHLLELWRNFICGNETGIPGRAVSLHLARSGSQSEHRTRRILPARGACHIIKTIKELLLYAYVVVKTANRELKKATFLSHGRTSEVYIWQAKLLVCPRFSQLVVSIRVKRYLTI